MLTVELLTRLSKECGGRPSKAVVQGIVDNQHYLTEGGIDTLAEVAEWAAQACVETNYFGTLKELGGAKYFAKYNGRRDLGNTQPGDGPRFPGRGVFQITGRDNYDRYGKRIGVDLIKNPELAERPDISVRTSVLYWNDKKLSPYAERGDTKAISRAINRGNAKATKAANHEAERIRCAKIARQVLGVAIPVKPKPAPIMSEPKPAPIKTYEDEKTVTFVQTKLREIGYAEVGVADGKIGDFTRKTIVLYRGDKGLPYSDQIDDELVLTLATDTEKRKQPEGRATATPAEVRERIPEAQATWVGKIAGYWTAGVSAVGAALNAAWDNLGEAKGYLEPIKDFVGDVPVWVWLAAIGGGAFLLSRKFAKGEKASVEAFQEGARR